MAIPKKRGNGEGTISRRKDGRWQAAIFIPLPNGERKRVYHYSDTRKECAEWLTEMRHNLQTGKPALTSDMTLSEWLTQWLDKYCINIRDSTRMNYETYMTHINRHSIGQISLSKLTTDDLQQFIIFLQKSGKLDKSGGLSAKTIRNLFQMLKKALKQALGNQMIWSNPADYVELPKVSQKKMQFLSTDEMCKLLDVSKDEAWQIGLIILLATGIRIGELLALRQDNLCCEKDIWYLDIRETLQRVKNYNAKEGDSKTILRCSDPKTENSRRQIPLLPEVMMMLQKHINRQKEAASHSYGLYAANPYLICNELGERIDPSTFRDWFNTMVEKADIKGEVTPHTLRHTFASQSLKSGMDIKSISTLLGHYSTDFTARTYVHTDLDGQLAAMNHYQTIIEEMLKP